MRTEKLLSTNEREIAERELDTLFLTGLNGYDNPFLYTRSGLLAKFLAMSEMYEKILDVPGNILEVGCWYGQSSIIFENLRAIFEPFNYTRRIVSFDTFTGYLETNGLNISKSEVSKYLVGDNWINILEEIQKNHKIINRSHTIFDNVAGDIALTIPQYLKSHTEPISLVYFDIATYDTLKISFELLAPFISKGGLFILDDYGPQYEGVHKYIIESEIHKKYKVTHVKKYKSKLIIEF